VHDFNNPTSPGACGAGPGAHGEPEGASAARSRALALAAGGRFDAAIKAYQHAARLEPRDASIFVEVGHLLARLGRLENALAAFDVACRLEPDEASAWASKAMILAALNRHEQALAALSALGSRGSSIDYLPGVKLHAQLHCCDWSTLTAYRAAIAERVRSGARVDVPLTFIAHNDDPADQRRCAETYVLDRCSIAVAPARPAAAAPAARLRIAYVSADFRDHPVAQLLAGVIESHDRASIESYAFSAGRDDGSALRRRLEQKFDHFLDVSALPDATIATRMAELSIHIAVDLGGHTLGARTRVLAHRAAPLQVSFLGFPGTSGAAFMDYIIADRHVIPEAERGHYSEQIIYLPDSYLPKDFAAPIHSVPTRLEVGLPASGIVFCCFNAPYKLSPALFDVWMRLLDALPQSVLWLREMSATARANLAKEAQRRGVDPRRLIHAPGVATLAEHYARLSLADIFLDTSPYNAHTTASDALGVGVPLITLRGRSFASRVATSLLEAVGLGHLSVATPEEYQQLAISLGRTRGALIELKSYLRRVRMTAPLFDTVRFCRHLEAAYREIWARHQRREVPSTLWVPMLGGDEPRVRGEPV